MLFDVAHRIKQPIPKPKLQNFPKMFYQIRQIVYKGKKKANQFDRIEQALEAIKIALIGPMKI